MLVSQRTTAEQRVVELRAAGLAVVHDSRPACARSSMPGSAAGLVLKHAHPVRLQQWCWLRESGPGLVSCLGVPKEARSWFFYCMDTPQGGDLKLSVVVPGFVDVVTMDCSEAYLYTYFEHTPRLRMVRMVQRHGVHAPTNDSGVILMEAHHQK